MRYWLNIVFFLFTTVLLAQSTTSPLNILFVGNSLTYLYDVPQKFEAIGEEQGYYINLDQHTIGGAGFHDHVNNTELYQKFDNTIWDYVILQPGTGESVETVQPIEFTINQALVLRDKIFENSPCASIYLYETSYGIVDESPEELQQYLSVQQLIKANLLQMSNQTNLPLVPVGEVFQTSIQQNSSEFLWISYNDLHQNEKGAFLAACTFFNALFKTTIVNPFYNGILTESEGNYLRSVAQDVTLNNLTEWNIDTLTANANFSFSSSDGINVDFYNSSTNYDSVFWDFGDGVTSVNENPTHQFDFDTSDSYLVYLTAYLGCKKSHFMQVVSFSTLGVESGLDREFKLFPNPVHDYFSIYASTDSVLHFTIRDVLGKTIKSDSIESLNQKVNVMFLQRGIYFLTINSGNNENTIKFIKM